MQELPTHLTIEARIRDRYVVESLPGQGRFGDIYLTTDLHRRQELFALAKVINPGEQERYNFVKLSVNSGQAEREKRMPLA